MENFGGDAGCAAPSCGSPGPSNARLGARWGPRQRGIVGRYRGRQEMKQIHQIRDVSPSFCVSFFLFPFLFIFTQTVAKSPSAASAAKPLSAASPVVPQLPGAGAASSQRCGSRCRPSGFPGPPGIPPARPGRPRDTGRPKDGGHQPRTCDGVGFYLFARTHSRKALKRQTRPLKFPDTEIQVQPGVASPARRRGKRLMNPC